MNGRNETKSLLAKGHFLAFFLVVMVVFFAFLFALFAVVVVFSYCGGREGRGGKVREGGGGKVREGER